MKLKHCNVIIAAYKAERWILECLESVRRQRTVLGWDYHTLVGVDGCEETSEVLARRGYTHYYSPVNVGPYVMRNSLFGVRSADAYAVFDADDMMSDMYLSTLIKHLDNGIAGAGRITINEQQKQIEGRTRYRCGVCMISSAAMLKLGGYVDHRVAADYDLIERAKLLHIPLSKVQGSLYFRRRHAESLTQRSDTGMKSRFRWEQVAEAKKRRLAGALTIIPKVTSLTLKEGFYK